MTPPPGRGPAGFLNGFSLILLGLAIYLPALGQIPLIRAEAMYALVPQEMLAAGQWLIPTLNGVPYLDKPPLLCWLNLLAFKVFGASAGVARLVTLMLTLGEVWVTYLIGRCLVGPRAAWLGGFILLSSIGFFSLHLQLLTDHLITLTLTASLYFSLRWAEKPSFYWVACFSLALVAGFLSKGFIGVIFPILISGLYAWYLKKPHLLRLLWSPTGLALGLLLVAPWFVWVEQANPGFIRFHLINEQVLRFLGQRQPPDITPFSIPGFWLFFAIWLMPWTLLLPEALYRFWRESGGGEGEQRRARLLLIWAGVIMVFFTLSSSRIEYYSLPALPPLALLLGWRVARYLDTPGDRSLSWTLVPLAVLGVAVLMLLPYLEQLCGDNRREFIGMFTLIEPIARRVVLVVPGLAILGVIVGWRRPRLTVAGFGVLALTLLFFTFQTLVALSPHLSDQLPGDYLRRHAGPEDLVVMENIEEFEYGASLAFYSGRRVLMVQRQGLPQFPYPVSPELNYLISPNRLQELWQGPHRVFLLVDDASSPADFLQGAAAAMTIPGKRLLVNRP